jgi:integrase
VAWLRTRTPSVYVRHQKGCAAHEGGRCRCTPSYYAQARDKDTGKVVKSPTMPTLNEAAGWLADFKRGRVAAVTHVPTFDELVERFLNDAERGLTRAKRGGAYAPRTITTYRQAWERHIRDDIGRVKATELTAADWQGLVDRLHSQNGLATNTISTVLMVVRATYRWACAPARRILPLNETHGLELPAPDEVARDRIAPPAEASALLASLDEPGTKTAYGLAMYGGLRRCELLPCEWGWIDFERGVIDVQKSKSKAGIRLVPMAGPLRALLLEERMRQGNPAPDRRVVTTGYSSILRWADLGFKAAELEPIGLHECRHTYASFMIAAGVNAKAISTYMGHSSIQITFDRYGHLMPGNEQEAADLLDAYLQRRAA